MKLLQYISIIVFVAAFGCTTTKQTEPFDDFSALIQPVSKTSILAEDGYYVWGGSAVKGDDNLYHMYYSRWKTKFGFNAWVTHSEIAHAISEKPEGPFKFKDIALPIRGAEYWDGLTTHNPTIQKFDGKYYLYYMGTTGDGIADPNLNFIHRNNQRIGVAWATNPNGPWNRSDKPFVDVSKDECADDALMTSNPSVTKMRGGKYLVVYKAVAKHKPLPFGGPVTHLAAISETPLGPITKYKQRIFYREGEHFAAEDPYVWYQKSADMYYAIVKDMKGVFTNCGTSLAFFKSKDGLNWEPSNIPLASKLEINWANGEREKVSRLERPQVLCEDSIPIMLYCAVTKGSETFNVHFPLKMEEEYSIDK